MEPWKSSEAQQAFFRKAGEGGTPVAGICRKAGIFQATDDRCWIDASLRHS